VKEVNDKGHTALHLAAKSGRNQIVSLLQEKVPPSFRAKGYEPHRFPAHML